MSFVVLLLCSVCLTMVRSFALPVRLVIHRQNRYTGSLYGADSRRAGQEERRKLMEGVARGDSYEYEYDGKIMTYTPPATPLEAELPTQRTGPQASVPVSTEFVASYGLESAFTSRGLNQPLLPAEYEMAFDMFPRLRQAAIDKVWPEQTMLRYGGCWYVHGIAARTKTHRHNASYLEEELARVSTGLDACRVQSQPNDVPYDMGEVSKYLFDAVGTRNVTLFIHTLAKFNMNINRNIRQVAVPARITSQQDSSAVTTTPAQMIVLNLHTLLLEFLCPLLPSVNNMYRCNKDIIQDIVLRIVQMALFVLHAGLAAGQKSTIYYGDFLTRRTTGEGYLPPAEAVELTVNYVFGKLQVVQDEDHPMECAYNVVKR